MLQYNNCSQKVFTMSFNLFRDEELNKSNPNYCSLLHTSNYSLTIMSINSAIEFLKGHDVKKFSNRYILELINENPHIFNLSKLEKLVEQGGLTLIFSYKTLIGFTSNKNKTRSKRRSTQLANFELNINLYYRNISKTTNQYMNKLIRDLGQPKFYFSTVVPIKFKKQDPFGIFDTEYEYVKNYLVYHKTVYKTVNLAEITKIPESVELSNSEIVRYFKYIAQAINEGVVKSRFTKGAKFVKFLLQFKQNGKHRKVDTRKVYAVCVNKSGLVCFKLLNLEPEIHDVNLSTGYKFRTTSKTSKIREKYKLFKKITSYIEMVNE